MALQELEIPNFFFFFITGFITVGSNRSSANTSCGNVMPFVEGCVDSRIMPYV